MAKKIIVKQLKSSIKTTKDQKATLEALGLRGINKVAEHENIPSIVGMINKVKHLISVENK